MTRQEIREAAEWLKNWYLTAESGEYIFEKHIAVCNHALSTIAPDEDEPVTDEWLREEWGFEGWEPSMLMRDKICACKCPSDSASQMSIWLWSKNGISDMRRITRVTTRSQFRSLMKGLGIGSKNKSQETDECFICGSVIEYGECECTDD